VSTGESLVKQVEDFYELVGTYVVAVTIATEELVGPHALPPHVMNDIEILTHLMDDWRS
jgi:hypothetical protein